MMLMADAVDERLGLPSASALERLAACPGSLEAERGMPDQASEMSTAGDRIHLTLAGDFPWDELTDDEAKVGMACRELMESVCRDYGFEDGEVTLEERLWLREEDKPIMSGKPDVVVSDGKRLLIADYKTGPVAVEHAARNLQLRALAVMAAMEHGIYDVTVAIVQPRVYDAQVTVAAYGEVAIWKAHSEILRVLGDAMAPDAPRRASEKACRYCKARAVCKEALETMNEITKTNTTEIGVPTPDLLERCAIAKNIIEEIQKAARAALEADPAAIAGWELKPGAKRQVVTDPEGVYGAAAIRGVTGSEFAGICTVTKSKLKALFKTKMGLKGAALEEAMAECLTGNTETKQNAPSLSRVRHSAEVAA